MRGTDADDRSFEIETRLDNLGARGLYLRMTPRVSIGSKLFIVISLAAAPTGEISTPCVAVRGVVLRVEPLSGGGFGVAIKFTQHRFL